MYILGAQYKLSDRCFYYKADKHFQHFYYVYNLMRDYSNKRLPKRIKRITPMSLCNFIEICVVCNFREDDLQYISNTKGKTNIKTFF